MNCDQLLEDIKKNPELLLEDPYLIVSDFTIPEYIKFVHTSLSQEDGT